MDLYTKPPGKPWKKLQKLVKRHEQYGGYGAFHSGLAFGADGTLHMVVDFHEGKGIMDRQGLHQAVCYMRSGDGGQTWQKADGTPVQLPARPEGMDILARDTAPSRHEPMPPPVVLAEGCLAVDSQGNPHVLYISHLDEPGQLIHATANDQGHWNQRPIEAIQKTYPRMRPVGCRGALSIGEDNRFYALLDLYPLDVGWTDDGKLARNMRLSPGCQPQLACLISGDAPNAFTTAPALEDGAIYNQPNLERPTSVNRIPAGQRPGFIYFDGVSRYPKKDEILQNNVYFLRQSEAGAMTSAILTIIVLTVASATFAVEPCPYSSKDVTTTIVAEIDGKAQTVAEMRADTNDAFEMAGPIRGKTLSRLTLKFTLEPGASILPPANEKGGSSKSRAIQLRWVMLEKDGNAWTPAKEPFKGMLVEESVERFEPGLGLLFGTEELQRTRDMVASPAFASVWKADCEYAAKQFEVDPATLIRPYSLYALTRYGRDSDLGYETVHDGVALALVGLLSRDERYPRRAAR